MVYMKTLSEKTQKMIDKKQAEMEARVAKFREDFTNPLHALLDRYESKRFETQQNYLIKESKILNKLIGKGYLK